MVKAMVDRTTRTLKGAEVVVQLLEELGVRWIFGIPGGASLPLYDALYDAHGIQHVLVRHEQVAAHAATGYARASGEVGVCTATSGPGATNLVTGLADAFMDSAPVLAITGQVVRPNIGTDAFQEADVTAITMPVTKHNYLVMDPAELPRVMREAYYLCRAGRPGPVLVDIPRDVLQAEIPTELLRAPFEPRYQPILDGDPARIAEAAEAISRSRRPILYVGGGAQGASEPLARLARRCRIPVTVTLMGKGAFDETDPLCLGMLGMHGTAYANYAINEADLVIAVGARFDDRVTGRLKDFCPHARFIHIDIDPSEIGKNKPAHIPIVGDARRVLEALEPLVQPPDLEAWWRQIEEWRTRYPLRWRPGRMLKPQQVIETIYQATRGEALVVTDVGQHQMWTAQYYKCRRPRQFITSGGLGAMGFGFPAAMGAQFARPDDLVIAIVGDGGFQMTVQDLITAVEWRLPLKIYVINNGAHGMVRQWQQLFYNERYSHVFLRNPDFARVAEAFGAVGIRVETEEQMHAAIQRSLEVQDRPVVVDFIVDPEENCYPMIPSGQSVKEMILGE
ncbi:MAG: biosynthetic-type acetolactate synthase large subunit [Armatimonadota bacterium]|nr:biosynthetic-type acetolactate synthase large subunit [Armatimonadota bacterium]MDR7563508.1 biosynthetic-type acetolactate synthase large subunit [Armatimonadota bacterium]MDR7601585.1 biosynthetic-type acetolactate synthase large subunit [Armatimonadota bacterium]